MAGGVVGASRILTIDIGSSSIKCSLYEMPSETLIYSDVRKADSLTASLDELALAHLEPTAVGHRIVFGGAEHVVPERVSPELIEDLERLVAFDPLHLRAELEAAKLVAGRMPDVPQVFCFDTAFHHRMPDVAKRYALPKEFGDVRRFGYHGLSYEYVMSVVGDAGRTVIAHLGNGASLAAVHDGVPVDTTMGFSPLGGVIMGTRPGDLDPGVILYAANELGLAPHELRRLLAEQSGLLAISGSTGDMEQLIARAPSDWRAEMAIEMFAYSVRKAVASMAAAMSGIDRLVFAGGIGENASWVRARICDGLGFLGICLDRERNEENAEDIGTSACEIAVRIVKTNEGLTIARHVGRILAT